MMQSKSAELQKIIAENLNEDLAALALKLELPWDEKTFVLNQIKGRQTAKHKFPTWFKNEKISYPNSISLQQSSSEITAKYKAEIIEKGIYFVDLTGGLGIDTFFLSQKFEKVNYVEPNKDLFDAAKHNFDALGQKNITCKNQSAEDFLSESKENIDLIYIDPSRRKNGKKVFLLEDCVPNLIEIIPICLAKAKKMMVKISPLFDIKQFINIFSECNKVHILSVRNECKELLFELKKDNKKDAEICTINFNKEQKQQFNFHFSQEENSQINFSKPLKYIYLPNSSVLKAGAFKTLSEKFEVKKLAKNTHIYTSEKWISDFPGKIFELENDTDNSNNLKPLLTEKSYNIICKNVPFSEVKLAQKLKITMGGEKYIICCKNFKDVICYLVLKPI